MILSKQELRIEFGSNADIFIDVENKVAYKVFRSFLHHEIKKSGEKGYGEETFRRYKRAVFQAELCAYELVQHSELLRSFTPIFHGREVLEGVMGEIGEEESHFYLLDCCLKLELIEGEDRKWSEPTWRTGAAATILSDNNMSAQSLEEEFLKHGIGYLLDASVIINESELKVIDFATHEVISPTLPPIGTDDNPYSGIDLDR